MKNTNLEDFEKTLTPWIGRNAKHFGVFNHDVLKRKGDINKEQLLILKYLIHEDGQVQNDLALITEKDKTTLTRLINKMEKKELVKRVQCANDQRCNKIFITEKGKKKFEDVFPFLVENAQKIQGNLTDEEIANTITVLKKLLHNIKEINNEIK